ncbi:MAG TPA: CPBP family intramembrane glutamic endopeptidase [Steroidobacteraceae bacterium]|nr:CPBP family intramembrane glutamic endopeptidase [Steroidobacteraceae bacterium]
MRAFAIFIGLIVLGLAGIAFLGYPAWLSISPLLDNPKFHRVSSRVGMLLLTIGFILVVRWLGMADRKSLGFGLPFWKFAGEVGKALALGIVLMMPALITMLVLDMRELVGEPLSMVQWVRLALGAIITGLTVALIEETFLRGAMQFAITRESGTRIAIALTSLVYAATHFLGRYRVPAAEVDAGSGIDMVAFALAGFTRPLEFIDAFLCLTAVGVLLGMARAYTGNIAASVGLHAGWVAVIYVVRETSQREEGGPLRWMLSDFDGFIGWMVLAWTIMIGVALYFWVNSGHSPFPREAGKRGRTV